MKALTAKDIEEIVKIVKDLEYEVKTAPYHEIEKWSLKRTLHEEALLRFMNYKNNK